jgi:hypothetical protein
MSDAIIFQCDLSTTDPTAPLSFEILSNGTSVFKLDHVKESCQISVDINAHEENATQTLQFIMSGKATKHTKIDDQGNITSDAMLTIRNIIMDDINISMMFNGLATYSHNFNSTQPAIEEKFYDNMGCNGIVTFEFTTPFYLWLLENM